MSNWKDTQDDSNFQSTIKAGDGALEELRKMWKALKNAGKAQASEAEQLIGESDDLVRRSSTWLTVVIFVAVSLLATPTKAQDLPQVPPAPTVGEPARIERVYLPFAAMNDDIVTGCEDCNPGGGNAHVTVNWNSKQADSEYSTYGGWQARGNQYND